MISCTFCQSCSVRVTQEEFLFRSFFFLEFASLYLRALKGAGQHPHAHTSPPGPSCSLALPQSGSANMPQSPLAGPYSSSTCPVSPSHSLCTGMLSRTTKQVCNSTTADFSRRNTSVGETKGPLHSVSATPDV